MGIVVAALSATAAPAATWQRVPSDNPDPTSDLLAGVSIVPGGSTGWAVGQASAGTLAEMWSASGLTAVPTPSPGTNPHLNAVVSLSTTDAWAVGSYTRPDGTEHTLALHWNGIAWKTQPTQTIPSRTSELTGVAAHSPTSVWAVGFRVGTGSVRTLILHWNGHRWHNVPSPNPADLDRQHNDSLTAVCAVPGTGALWAVGKSGTLGRPLVLRYTGTAWVQAKLPLGDLPKNGVGSSLSGVAASKRVVVAVGSFFNPGNGHSLPIALRHTSSGWSVSHPVKGDGSFGFSAVTHVPHQSDFWAVGNFVNSGDHGEALAEHWSPPSWTVSAVGDLDPSDETSFEGVAATAGKVLAVGRDFIFGTGNRTLAELRQ